MHCYGRISKKDVMERREKKNAQGGIKRKMEIWQTFEFVEDDYGNQYMYMSTGARVLIIGSQ